VSVGEEAHCPDLLYTVGKSLDAKLVPMITMQFTEGESVDVLGVLTWLYQFWAGIGMVQHH
jgi:hypothetical protein